MFLAFGFTACAPRETPIVSGTTTQTLHRGIGNDLADLDPHLATQAADYNVLSALLEGLVAEDPVDLHPVPGVAQSWTISPDGRTYTFHLRTDARWSNGASVTAGDFVDSWRRMLTPTLGADSANLLYIIQGAEAFHKSTAPWSAVGLAAPDARTFIVTLEHPAPHFLALLNHTAFFPVYLPAIEKSGSATDRGNPWARPGTFVGNGPFNLKTWRAGQVIIAEKSPTYWDVTNVRLNAIHFHAIESVDTEERAFRAGQLHLTETVPPGKIDSYRKSSPELLRIDPLLGTYFFRLNVNRPPLTDPRIRRALSLALDRTAIVEKILRGGQLSALRLVPPALLASPIDALPSAAPGAAAALLAEAGYPGGRGLPPLDLLFNTSEIHRTIAEAVQEMWRRELGLEVRLTNQELKSTLSARRAGDFQMLRSVWTADYADPTSFLSIFTTANGNNYTGWADSAYDAALFAAARTSELVARNALFNQAERILLDAAPIIPIFHYTHVFLLQPSVRGWNSTVLDHHPYKHVWLESR
ncbi:MAG: peptide ABC transporter substrate-binding protein [Opitutaceae bacterium]|nr:peptide ABC transporter substrate-binding protein [Opitutaceae bacterium]